MRRGQRLPDDQTEIVFSDVFVEQLEALHDDDQVGVLAAIVHLCADPAGKHALGNKDDMVLAGWNTLDVLATEHRVVYRASNQYGTGLIEVLCLGMRRGSVVYDMADALKDSGALSDGQVTQLWIALSLLDVVAEKVGLDGWDYRSPPAPAGMVRAVVAAGLLSQHIAELLSKDEIEAAQTEGWGPAGKSEFVNIKYPLHRPQVPWGNYLVRVGGRATGSYDPATARPCRSQRNMSA